MVMLKNIILNEFFAEDTHTQTPDRENNTHSPSCNKFLFEVLGRAAELELFQSTVADGWSTFAIEVQIIFKLDFAWALA
jgi:hypothetical protein